MAASGLADFIFVKSTTKSDVYTKKAAWPAGEFEIVNYEPIEDDEKEWVSKEVKEQISSTVSNVRAKQLKDTDSVYIVLGVTAKFVPNENNPSKTRKQVFDPLMLNVLKRLSANILAYLNTEHTKLLVSCPIWKLTEALDKERYAKKYFEGIKRIGPLLPMEQISKFLRQNSAWAKEPRELIIQLIPNLPTEKREAYSKNITDYLKSVDSNASSYEGSDFILANIKQKPAEDLLKTSNFIFKLFEVPEGFAERVKLPEKKPLIRKRKGIRASGSSAVDSSLGNLPTVCILDSGVTEIPQLKGFLVTQDGYGFSNLNDDYKNHGHGTPIAYLAIFGEVPSVAKARVISYKIYSDVNKRVYPEGYRRAIAKYSNPESPFRTKIFLSSISFKDDNSEVTAYIDRLIQENNVCAVFAAGNIDPRIVSNYAFDGVPCSSYVCNHPLQDPAQALNALSVGAIAKKEASNSISRRNELSPFTTCGTTNSGLYESPKPEFVQHGGNQCKDGTKLGVESYNKQGEKVNDLLGTSFSAPLLVHNIVQTYAKYCNKFHNAESLKALALASTNGNLQKCMGYGETKPFYACDPLHALILAEGEIFLPDTTDEHFRTDYSAKISIAIPKFVNCIKMFLVHSDNHYRVPMSYLNTYLKVKAKKTARDYGYVALSDPNEVDKKAHMKVFKWAFESQSMEGTWDFYIRPEVTADMLAEHKKATKVRYGCAFVIYSKTLTRPVTLTEEIYILNKQLGTLA